MRHFESLLFCQLATGMAQRMLWSLMASTCWQMLLAEGVRLMPKHNMNISFSGET